MSSSKQYPEKFKIEEVETSGTVLAMPEFFLNFKSPIQQKNHALHLFLIDRLNRIPNPNTPASHL